MDKLKLFLVFGLLVLNLSLYSFVFGFLNQNEFEIDFLPVGQGDAELIRTKRNFVLIDAGPGTKVLNELDKLVPVYKRRLDLVLITHPNIDHFSGLVELAKRYEIGVVVMNGVKTENGSFKNLLKTIVDQKIPVVYARRGQTIEFFDSIKDRVLITILWPDLNLPLGVSLPDKQLNDSSIVSLAEFKDFKVLFTGDISANVEKAILGFLPDIDVLKVAHHGSKYSTTREFLAAVRPELAVIEVGKNSYGHPTKETLARLGVQTKNVFRTDVDGLVKLFWQNNQWRVANSNQ